jgi:hypothetical protein
MFFAKRGFAVPTSVLEAIKLGLWDFEPQEETLQEHFQATGAMPGTPDKLDVLAERVRLGQPLWHPADRQDYDEVTGPLTLRGISPKRSPR